MKKRAARPKQNGAKEYNVIRQDRKALRQRRRKQRRRKRLRIMACAATLCTAIGLVIAIVGLNMVRNDLTTQVGKLQDKVDVLQSEYTSLKAQEQGTMTLTEIEEYAENKLGLVRLDSSQEEYVSVEKPDQVEVNSGSSGMDKLVSNFVKSFNAILSFLR